MSTPPFNLGGIDHVVLIVTDMDRAVAFYRDVLGAVEERRIESMGLVQMRAGASLIDLLPRSGQPAGVNVEHVALAVDRFDPEAVAAHLARHGIEAGEAATRYGAQGYGPSVYFRDPDGNTIELKGPPDSVEGS